MKSLATICLAIGCLAGLAQEPPALSWAGNWRLVTNPPAVVAPAPVRPLVFESSLALWDEANWYVLESSDDLIHWTPLVTNQTPAVLRPAVRIEAVAADPRRFFRIGQRTSL